MTEKYYVIPHVIYDTGNPGVSDDIMKGIEVGQIWQNTTTLDFFICIDKSSGAAKWRQLYVGFDPTENIVPSFQTEINNSVMLDNMLFTPQVTYMRGTIDYDLTIPVSANAFSVGPVTVSPGRTVTVNGTWVIL